MKENKALNHNMIGGRQDIQEAVFEADVQWQVIRIKFKPGTKDSVTQAILDGIKIRRNRQVLQLWLDHTQDDREMMP